jgi:hypothetical protein
MCGSFNVMISKVIQYFTKRLGPESGELGVSEVMEKIEDGTLHWSPDILRVKYTK